MTDVVLEGEGKPMPKALQIHIAKKLLQKHGIDPQTIDLEQKIDGTLRFEENIKLLSEELGIPLTKKLEELKKEKYSDDYVEQKNNELLEQWLIMELGEEEYYKILEELELQEEEKEQRVKEIQKEVEEMIKESEEKIKEEEKQRVKQLIEYWEDLKSQGILFDYLAHLIAPHLQGEQYQTIRKAILLVLASQSDIGTHRARLHCLLWGEPGTAKTEIIRWIDMYLAPHGIHTEYIDALRMSKVGLTVDARGKEPTPGALVKAHKGLALIDELDKAPAKDYEGLLQAMEIGQFKVTVGKVDEWFDAEVRVIATANDIKKFTQQLLDRFDFVFEVKKPSIEERKETVDKLVDQFFDEIDIGRPAYELAQYLRYISGFYPKADKDTIEKIKKIMRAYMDLRKDSKLTDSSYRNFELSIFRIAYAYAKLHKRNIQPEDVIEALKLKDPEIAKNSTILVTLYAIAKGTLNAIENENVKV